MEKIEARMIIEIMGRPAGHIVSTMKALVEKMGGESGVHMKEHKVHDAIPIKDANNLFSTFAEVVAEFDSTQQYLNVIYGYMPANIEIISPERFDITKEGMSDIGNSIVERLHFYDSVAKRLVSEKHILAGQLKHVMAGGKLEPKDMQIDKPKEESIKKNKKAKKGKKK